MNNRFVFCWTGPSMLACLDQGRTCVDRVAECNSTCWKLVVLRRISSRVSSSLYLKVAPPTITGRAVQVRQHTDHFASGSL